MNAGFDPRSTAQLVREALDVLYQQRSQAGELTLIQELEAEAAQAMTIVESVLDGMARQRRIWEVERMTTKIADAKAPIASRFSPGRWLEIKTVFDAFGKWAKTPLVIIPADEEKNITEIAATPEEIISRRSDPYATPANAPEPVVPAMPPLIQP